MVKEDACGWCGEWFVKKGNQKYCCKECSRLAERQSQRLLDKKRREANRQRVAKKNALRGVPSISLDAMVDLMLKLSKEKGRTVQYGEVQRLLLTGRLKVKDGVII